ncbi:MAG: LacI family DNA-binding transcriptional regulator [Clostridiaceae bacterium]|nr:LacI family DNA-binding transcriptional regulator [Clostridiaceae bacterium]
MTEKTEPTYDTVTIKDIAARLKVSSVSVHRALSNKDGVSDILRKKILETAQEMGYEINYAAASIKRKPCRMAIVMPQDEGLYFSCIWEGVRAGSKEAKGLNVEVKEIYCRDEQHQYELLKQIADTEGEYTGVVTFSYTRSPKVLMQLQRLVSQKITTVVVDDELKEPEGLYCIPSNEKVLGRVAGEFISLITPEIGTVLVSEGRPDSKTHINKIKSFIESIAEKKTGLKVQVVTGYSNKPGLEEMVCNALKKAYLQYPDTVAAYALTSHDNDLMVRAAEETGVANHVAIVGTDLNDMTACLLQQGKIKAVINQAAYAKGYASLQILVERIVKNIEPPQRVDCPIDIVLSSNLGFYRSSDKMTWR